MFSKNVFYLYYYPIKRQSLKKGHNLKNLTDFYIPRTPLQAKIPGTDPNCFVDAPFILWIACRFNSLKETTSSRHSGFASVRNTVRRSNRRIFILAATHLAVIPLQVCLIFAIIKKCQLIHLALLFILLKL